MAHIPDSLRQQVIARAQGRCEHCQTQQVIVVSMEIDHIKPEAAGGETTLDNLCLAYAGCNGYKLHFQSGIDPQTNQEAPLFNPRILRWREHFGWSVDGTLMLGLTPIGRATIARLHMNRDAAGWMPSRFHPAAKIELSQPDIRAAVTGTFGVLLRGFISSPGNR